MVLVKPFSSPGWSELRSYTMCSSSSHFSQFWWNLRVPCKAPKVQAKGPKADHCLGALHPADARWDILMGLPALEMGCLGSDINLGDSSHRSSNLHGCNLGCIDQIKPEALGPRIWSWGTWSSRPWNSHFWLGIFWLISIIWYVWSRPKQVCYSCQSYVITTPK